MAKKKVTVVITEDIHINIKKLAADRNIKISELYEDILLTGLKVLSEKPISEGQEVK